RTRATQADGEEPDVTPLVTGLDYYTFTVNATKHRLVHQTQCVALANPRTDRTRLGVGEYVNFSFDPGPGYESP
ncbi:MAG TPA: hypothetical protein PLT00_08215, partial [Verrucomicrobiota bacterium]|nr:hypothetical protein [Verrucomicrobiota bacterium]HQB16680.1 hypothetical protein [Verrucomicrobiota bacterium]